MNKLAEQILDDWKPHRYSAVSSTLDKGTLCFHLILHLNNVDVPTFDFSSETVLYLELSEARDFFLQFNKCVSPVFTFSDVMV